MHVSTPKTRQQTSNRGTPIGKVQLKLGDDILTSPVEVNLQSKDVADK